MLDEDAVRVTARWRAWLLITSMMIGVTTVALYFVLIGFTISRERLITYSVRAFGDSARDFVSPVVLFIAVPLLVVPILVGAYSSNRFKMNCPNCNRDISNSLYKVLLTRCCSYCCENIVAGGKPRSADVLKRRRAIQSQALLKYAFWAWPLIGLLFMMIGGFDRDALQQCPQLYVLPSIIGTSTAGWAWIRTFDRRYLPPLFASVTLLATGSWLFWKSI